MQLASKQKKYRTFLGCNSVSNIDKRWSLCELQLAFGQTKPHPIKLLLYYFPYGVHPYCTDNTDNINLHNAPLARTSVRPYFFGGFRPIKSKFLIRLTSNLGLLLRGVWLSSLLIFRKIGPILALWRPKNLQKSGQIDTHRQRFPTDKVKVSQPIDF